MSEPVIRSIPLSQLELSPANVRKTDAGERALAELKASIAAHGLLENLVARCLGPGADGTGRYAVIAGGRRLAAMKALAREGTLDEDFPVPCRMTNDAAGEAELSLAENAVRAAMHPADQVEAFKALAGAGSRVADIAARFGVSERTVEKRLRLGGVAPEILNAYRAGELDLEALTAFAVTADRGRQLAVWNEAKEQYHRPLGLAGETHAHRRPGPGLVRRRPLRRRRGLRGGGRHGHPRPLRRGRRPGNLARRSRAFAQARHGQARSRGARSALRMEVGRGGPGDRLERHVPRYGRVYPEPGEATEEEGAEIERLRTRHDELANLDEDDWTDELIAEGEAIEERLGELETAINTRAAYHPERKAVAGCLVTIGHNGELRVEEGLVKPEDVPEAGRTSSEDGDPFSSAVMPPPAAPPDPAAVARKRVGVGAGLADDLRAVRTGIVKSRLAEDFGAAFDLLLFQLARGVFANGYRADALDIAVRETVDRPMGRGSGDGFPEFDERERLLAEDRAALSLGWMDEEDDGDAFAKLRALSESAKQRLFASCVARTVIGQLAFEPSVRPELEAAIARLDIDFAERFRPSADLFWSRITKARILEIARAALGPAWAQAHAKSRKPELAKAMERAFAVGESVPCGITSLARTKALAWTPPGIRSLRRLRR